MSVCLETRFKTFTALLSHTVFSFDINLIQKYTQSHQTVTVINASRVLSIISSLHSFLSIETQLSLLKQLSSSQTGSR